MIKSKYKKWLIISFCILFVIMSVITGAMSENVLHTKHCDTNNCQLCKIIHISTDFARNIRLIYINILILIVSIPLIQLINKNIKEAKKLTLVEMKVIQNK